MILPAFESYRALARDHEIVPVYREILADEETPVSAFRKLDDGGTIALLESVEGNETWGRFSMIALDPAGLFESRGDQLTLRLGESVETRRSEAPLRELEALVRGGGAATLPGLPRLAGGAVGFVAYDMVRRFERLPEQVTDDLSVPDCRFVLFRTAVLFDHQFHTLKVVVNTRPRQDEPRAAYEAALQRLDEVIRKLRAPLPPVAGAPTAPPLEIRSSMSRTAYEAAVETAKEYILAGDIFQVVLAHRLETEIFVDPFEIYRALRVINPSPYMFHLRLEDVTVVGASPEALVRREGPRIETLPIAGTRPRGRDEAEDLANEKDLRASEKERAEHVMLVDLGRNDLGRVARHGTVTTKDFMSVERYSHVMHLVTSVRGEVEEDTPNAEILPACFPAGTVSGAPKIRAMEIIDELEPCRRGIYAGAVGYFDYHGNMDTCIAIRTLMVRDGRAYLGVGAGIVADSDPAAEYEETLNKGGALLRAVELAHHGLQGFSRASSNRRVGDVPAVEPGARSDEAPS